MANTAKMAILRAKVEGVLVDLMIKSNVQNVYFDDTTTLAAKLTEIVTSIGTKANTSDMNTAIANLRTELMGEGVPEAYDTFKELADYIETHQEAADALNAAIGTKADKTVVDAIKETVDGLGAMATKDNVTEADLDSALAAKVNAASEGNHSHANKALLDTYTQTEANLADAVSKKHAHANASVLDGISSAKVTAWDAAEQNAKTYADGLNTAMGERVTAVEGAKHTHSNSAVLDGITASKVTAWDAAEQNAKTYADGLNTAMDTRMVAVEGAKHTHANAAVLDGITAANVASWNGKAKVYASGETVDLAEGEIFVQLV